MHQHQTAVSQAKPLTATFVQPTGESSPCCRSVLLLLLLMALPRLCCCRVYGWAFIQTGWSIQASHEEDKQACLVHETPGQWIRSSMLATTCMAANHPVLADHAGSYTHVQHQIIAVSVAPVRVFKTPLHALSRNLWPCKGTAGRSAAAPAAAASAASCAPSAPSPVR